MLSKWLLSSFNSFAEAVKLNRAPHSVIISGSANLGSAALALHMAKLYLCMDKHDGSACGSCKSCQYFSTVLDEKFDPFDEDTPLEFDSHPDVVTLLPYDTEESQTDGLSRSFSELLKHSLASQTDSGSLNVKVDGVRSLCEWVLQGSVFGNGKVAIISDAHAMSDSAANALLKTFEEPPENSLIILLTNSLENLPATILSRAVKIQLPMVKTADALEYIRDKTGQSYNETEANAALALNDNSPAGALYCINSGLVKSLLEIVSLINKAVSYHGADERKSLEAREEAIKSLLLLSDEDKYSFLREFISELLKYKAGISLENLPLLFNRNLSKLCKIPAVKLFDTYSLLSILRTDTSKIQNKAPSAVLRTVIDTLRQTK